MIRNKAIHWAWRKSGHLLGASLLWRAEQLMLRKADFMALQLLPGTLCFREAHCQEQPHGKWFTLEVKEAGKDTARLLPKTML